jgi:hypothetical protein
MRLNANYFISPFSKLSFTLCVSLIYEPIVLFPVEEVMLFCKKTQLYVFPVKRQTLVHNANHKRVVMQFRMRQASGCRQLLRNAINSFVVGENMKLRTKKPIRAVVISSRSTTVM